MKNVMKFQIASLVVFSFLLLSCQESSIVDSIIFNTPAVAIRTNTFSYSIEARGYNVTENYNLDFSLQSIEIAIVVGLYSGGKIRIEIQSSTDSKIFEREYASGTAYSENLVLSQLPKKIQLKYENFSGTLSCAVTAKP